MADFEILLENLKFYAYHGVYEHETHDGNEFEVNLRVTFPDHISGASDYGYTLDKTISYVSLFKLVREEMNKPRKLLETLTAEMAKRIKEEYPFTTLIECKVSKVTPPIPGFIGSASVIYRI